MITPINVYNQFGERKVNELAHDNTYCQVVSGLLEVGSIYIILESDNGTDFTTVGATTNAVGTRFVCSAEALDWNSGDKLQKGYTDFEVVERNIAAAINFIKTIASQAQKVYEEGNIFIEQAVVYYTMYLLYVENEQQELGETEKREAVDILARLWGGSVYNYAGYSRAATESNSSTRQPSGVTKTVDWAAYDNEENQ